MPIKALLLNEDTAGPGFRPNRLDCGGENNTCSDGHGCISNCSDNPCSDNPCRDTPCSGANANFCHHEDGIIIPIPEPKNT